jgi:hypothetical protein
MQQISIYITTNQSLFFSNGMMGSSLAILEIKNKTAIILPNWFHIFSVYIAPFILCISQFSFDFVKPYVLNSNPQKYFKSKNNLISNIAQG